MKICILGNAQSHHISRWAEFFVSRGHGVTVVSSRPQEIPGVEVHAPRLPAWLRRGKTFDAYRSANFGVYLGYGLLALQIRGLVKRIRPDLVMAITFETNGVLSLLTGFHPVTLWPLGHITMSVKSETSLVVRYLVRRMLRYADLVYTGEGSGVRRLEQLGCDPEKIRVFVFGIDVEQFRPDLRSEELRAELGVSDPDARLILCLRSLEVDYNAATFVRSIPGVVDQYPDTRFVLIGDGPEWDNIQQLIDDLDVRSYIHCAGYLPFDELPRYLASADVYVDPVHWRLPQGRSWWGHRRQCSTAGLGFTVALLMAMSCGLTPVVSRRVGMEDVLEEELAALMWQGGDSEDLARRLNDVLGRPEFLAEYRRKNRDLAVERFQWSQNCLEVEKTYLGLVGRRE